MTSPDRLEGLIAEDLHRRQCVFINAAPSVAQLAVIASAPAVAMKPGSCRLGSICKGGQGVHPWKLSV